MAPEYYIGLDLGTSALKGLLLDGEGRIVKEARAGYPVFSPHEGWSEQNPADWLSACEKVLFELSEGVRSAVKGISIAGQMHGLVLLDERDEVIRPAILWNDGRTQAETDLLNRTVGRETLSRYTANVAFAGFTAPKILWVKAHEPQNFSRIRKICLPKDYLAYRLTGVFSTDCSDASGTLLFDVKNRRWSKEMLEICSVKEEWLPAVFESYEPTGKVRGFENAVLAAGAGDNAANAIGTGTVRAGDCSVSLGTSGTVFVAGDTFLADGSNALHSFCHANGKWHLMGCILSAASANKWWLEDILGTRDYDGAAAGANPGENSVFFLPYLMGERSPHNDANARGAFVGLHAGTTRQEMSLAVLEGVSFALCDCVERARKSGLAIERAALSGGGAKSRLWREILSNVLNCEIFSIETEQGPSFGAAILAMTAGGRLKNPAEGTSFLRVRESILPDPELVERYRVRYRRFTTLYPRLKGF